MSSFQSFLHIGGKRYEILYSDLDIHQKIDSLGRPASLTFGGMFNVEMNMPDSGDSTLFDSLYYLNLPLQLEMLAQIQPPDLFVVG